eukprot:14698345-Alexandrium_andersonii.AAC.1
MAAGCLVHSRARRPLRPRTAGRAGGRLSPGRPGVPRARCPALPLQRGLRGQGPHRAGPCRRRPARRAPWPYLAVGRFGSAALRSPGSGGCRSGRHV